MKLRTALALFVFAASGAHATLNYSGDMNEAQDIALSMDTTVNIQDFNSFSLPDAIPLDGTPDADTGVVTFSLPEDPSAPGLVNQIWIDLLRDHEQ